jgi:hypothetical protein
MENMDAVIEKVKRDRDTFWESQLDQLQLDIKDIKGDKERYNKLCK